MPIPSTFHRGAYRYVKLLLLVTSYQRRNLTVPRVFRRTVERCPDRTALIFEDKRWTFLDLEDYSNRVANFFLRLGYKPGECVALFMENREAIQWTLAIFCPIELATELHSTVVKTA